MTECKFDNSKKLGFVFYQNRRLEADFTGGDLSSNGGLLLLRQLDERLGLFEKFSNCISDPRDPSRINHEQVELIRQRVLQICAGYEDANDSDSLRTDPILKAACNKLPESGKDLGSQPTITRLENRVTKGEVSKIRNFFVELFISSFRAAPKEIVLDIDGFDDPTHGDQQLSFYHGYYRQHMYHPVMINHAGSGFPVALQLRAGNSHAGKGVKGLLRWLFFRLKLAFPGVVITLRGDGGFSLPEIIEVCERSNLYYVLGFSRNAVLERKNANLLEQARLQFLSTGKKARLFDDVYYQAGSWNAPRRILMKAECMEQGLNQRFVVTNRFEPAEELYDEFYVQRAEDSENRIKELKLDLKADRLSCHAFIANQFRLFLHQLGFVLMLELRKAAAGTQFEKARFSTLREKLIKLAVRVRESARRVWVQFASSCPVKDCLSLLAQKVALQT
jgi:Transposase DDE domain group 1